MDGDTNDERVLFWWASSRKDLLKQPQAVIQETGFLLGEIQNGRDHESIKALTGHEKFRASNVRETVIDDGDAYRTVVTIEHPEAVYVVHSFQKKSK